MLICRRSLLRDRSGVSNTAIALLVSIIDLLIYYSILNMPNGPEILFYLLYLFLRTIGVVGDDFGQFVEWVRGTPVWPLLTLIGSQIGMVLSVAITFAFTWWTVGITSRILAWRRARRERKRMIREKNEREYRLWKKRLEGEDEEPSVILPKLMKATGSPKFKTSTATGKINKVGKPIDWEDLTRIEWWQISKTQVLTLVEGKLKKLILEAKKLFPTEKSPQGSYKELARALGMTVPPLREAVKEGRDSMTVGNLLKLLDLLKMPYDALTPYIISVGGNAIMNPKFPINMNCPDGVRLEASALKDGHIDKNDHHFQYANFDQENRRIVAESVKRVFGDVEARPLYNQEGKQIGIYFSSAVIGDTLCRAGAVIGRKT